MDWQDDGSVAIKASNGRYLTAKMNGSLQATSDALTEKERFFVTIINRPILVLKCEFGFVGWRTSTNPRYECNKTTYSVILVEHAKGKSAAYYFKGRRSKGKSDGNSKGGVRRERAMLDDSKVDIRRKRAMLDNSKGRVRR